MLISCPPESMDNDLLHAEKYAKLLYVPIASDTFHFFKDSCMITSKIRELYISLVLRGKKTAFFTFSAVPYSLTVTSFLLILIDSFTFF